MNDIVTAFIADIAAGIDRVGFTQRTYIEMSDTGLLACSLGTAFYIDCDRKYPDLFPEQFTNQIGLYFAREEYELHPIHTIYTNHEALFDFLIKTFDTYRCVLTSVKETTLEKVLIINGEIALDAVVTWLNDLPDGIRYMGAFEELGNDIEGWIADDPRKWVIKLLTAANEAGLFYVKEGLAE